MLNVKKTKEDILSNLNANLPIVQSNGTVPNVKKGPSNDDIIVDAEEDYSFARDHIKKLINTSDEAIATMHALASDAEHPRAFEVLSAMIKSAADMNSQLLSLQKERKKIVQEPEPGSVKGNSTTTNNSIFVGTTTELQKLLKANSTDAIDI
jgi:nicotinamidase-related amidase